MLSVWASGWQPHQRRLIRHGTHAYTSKGIWQPSGSTAPPPPFSSPTHPNTQVALRLPLSSFIPCNISGPTPHCTRQSRSNSYALFEQFIHFHLVRPNSEHDRTRSRQSAQGWTFGTETQRLRRGTGLVQCRAPNHRQICLPDRYG